MRVINEEIIKFHLDFAEQTMKEKKDQYDKSKHNYIRYKHAYEVIQELGIETGAKQIQSITEMDIKGLHITQQKILNLARIEDVRSLSLARLGRKIGVKHPQNVKHHLNQLKLKQLI